MLGFATKRSASSDYFYWISRCCLVTVIRIIPKRLKQLPALASAWPKPTKFWYYGVIFSYCLGVAGWKQVWFIWKLAIHICASFIKRPLDSNSGVKKSHLWPVSNCFGCRERFVRRGPNVGYTEVIEFYYNSFSPANYPRACLSQSCNALIAGSDPIGRSGTFFMGSYRLYVGDGGRFG